MAKSIAKDPGTALKSFLDEYQLNPSNLGKAVGLSQSTIRQITLNKMKISIPIALRFAKFFGNSVDYWINLQTKYSLAEAAEDAELNQILDNITKPVKPPPAQKAARNTAPKAEAKKTAGVKVKPTKTAAAKAVKAPGRPRGRKTK
jgi:addiction module HigA family antidote